MLQISEFTRTSTFIDALQTKGRYTFSQKEIVSITGKSIIAIKNALRRLIKKGRLVSPRRGFYVIVPLEYKALGSPPASWFINNLMAYLKQPYYVGLLTASAIHGASHHKPQQFQVVTNKPIRPISVGRVHINFVTKYRIENTPTLSIKTETGNMLVSTPEATAFDLVRYMTIVGHISHIGTILNELAESLIPRRLVNVAKVDIELSCVQRIGYLLDLVCSKKITDPLHTWLSSQKIHPILLKPGSPVSKGNRNEKWSIIVNEQVEIDE